MKASESAVEHWATKPCKACGLTKPVSEFYKASKPGCFQSSCKDCMKDQATVRYREARENGTYNPSIERGEYEWQSWGNCLSVDMYNRYPIQGGYRTAPCKTT